MALSSIHEVEHHHHHHHHHGNHPHEIHAARIQHVVTDQEKHFRPNPDAKPFIPHVPAGFANPNNWHFFQNENTAKQLNGMIPQFWMGAPVLDNENILAAASGTNSNASKQHIAFHLVSNLLDDEIPEDNRGEQQQIAYLNKANQLHHQIHHNLMNNEQNLYGSNINELVNNWHQSAANFTLPVEVEKTSSDKSSINNKSIHEIWSPDPSPNGLSNLSPTEEILAAPYNQVADSPTSVVESAETSFEKVAIENNRNQRSVKYNNEEENNENINSPPYVQQNAHSNVYRHHYPYERNQHSGGAYPTKNMMYNHQNMRPMMDPHHYYGGHYPQHRYPPPHYAGGHMGYKVRGKHPSQHHHHAPPHMFMYNGSVSYVEELGIGLDECKDQLRHLERDCKKADLNLLQNFRVRKPSVESYTNKYPSNSTRVDKLVIDQDREHQKVESLIGRIERLGFTPMHPNVGVALDCWLAAIKDLRNTRKNEIANMHDITGNIHGAGKSHTQEDICNLIGSVKELTRHTRSARTIVWCALQMLFSSNSSAASSGSGD